MRTKIKSSYFFVSLSCQQTRWLLMVAYILSHFIYFITHTYPFPLLHYSICTLRIHAFSILTIWKFTRTFHFHLVICFPNVQLYFAIGHAPHLSFDNEILDTLTHWVKFIRANCACVCVCVTDVTANVFVFVCVCVCEQTHFGP